MKHWAKTSNYAELDKNGSHQLKQPNHKNLELEHFSINLMVDVLHFFVFKAVNWLGMANIGVL